MYTTFWLVSSTIHFLLYFSNVQYWIGVPPSPGLLIHTLVCAAWLHPLPGDVHIITGYFLPVLKHHWSLLFHFHHFMHFTLTTYVPSFTLTTYVPSLTYHTENGYIFHTNLGQILVIRCPCFTTAFQYWKQKLFQAFFSSLLIHMPFNSPISKPTLFSEQIFPLST